MSSRATRIACLVLGARAAAAQCIGPAAGIPPQPLPNKCPSDAFTLVASSAIDPSGNVAFIAVSSRTRNFTLQYKSQVRGDDVGGAAGGPVVARA